MNFVLFAAFYTPILAAAVNGVVEMVEKILQEFPMTIHDWDSTRKNIVLVAVESRQTHIYDFLLRRRSDVVDKDLAFHERDEKGNSALHIAAGLQNSRGWFIPTSMLQLQWEVKWFEVCAINSQSWVLLSKFFCFQFYPI